jgi:exonuclease III
MKLIDIYRVTHTAKAQYTFFSAAHRTFSKIDYILGHKGSLKNIRKLK